jgi:hypothetical protein
MDELDLSLGLAVMVLAVGIGYAWGKGNRTMLYVMGALFIAFYLFAGKHAKCPDCRNGFASWKRSLGRKLIE